MLVVDGQHKKNSMPFSEIICLIMFGQDIFFSVLQIFCICIMASGLCPYGILVSLRICVSVSTCVSCIFSGSLFVFVLLYYYPLDACFLFLLFNV